MRRKKKNERELRLAERSAVRKKNVEEYFVSFTRHHRPWLQELAQKYKECGEFPLMALTLLPSYYDSVQDKEVAAFAALLISDVENIGHTTYEKVAAFRKMLGKSPWEWFEKREFVSLSLGKYQHGRTGGIENWKIARLMNKLWEEHFDKTTKPVENIGQTIKLISDIQNCSYFDVLTYMLADCCVGNFFYKLRLLLMVLCSGGGFGISLWQNHNAQDILRCPLTHDLRLFLQTWFPNYRRYGSVDEAISLFGFEREIDFFYAYLGYKELQKRNPKGCSILATFYQNWYENGIKKKPYQWRKILFSIDDYITNISE